jgi:hypothetical protein
MTCLPHNLIAVACLLLIRFVGFANITVHSSGSEDGSGPRRRKADPPSSPPTPPQTAAMEVDSRWRPDPPAANTTAHRNLSRGTGLDEGLAPTSTLDATRQHAQSLIDKANKIEALRNKSRQISEKAKKGEAVRLEQEEADRLAARRLEKEAAARQLEKEAAARRLEKEEADRLEKEEADRLEKEEADRLEKEEADRLEKEEADRLEEEEADRLEKEEADRLEKEEASRLEKEEAFRLVPHRRRKRSKEKQPAIVPDGVSTAIVVHTEPIVVVPPAKRLRLRESPAEDSLPTETIDAAPTAEEEKEDEQEL